MPDAAKTWECFHCGAVMNAAEAREHFGLDSDYEPGCIEPLRTDENERLHVINALHAEMRAVEGDASALRGKVEGLEYALHLWQQQEPELIRRHKAKTLTEAVHNLDFLEGRVIAAEAMCAELKRRAPALWRAIQDHICRPVEPAEV